MELLNNIVQLLRKPFPEKESSLSYYRTIAIISLFVTFFLYIFEPFGFSNLESNKFLICLGFGAISFIASISYDFIFSKLFQVKGEREKFTFGKWLLNIFGLMMTISLANFLFARILFFGDIRWEFFPQMIYGTFTIGLFPVAVIGAISLLRQEKKYQHIAEEINQNKTSNSDIDSTTDISIHNISIHQIRYIEALQNYVKIGFINEQGKLIEQTERSTLKRILDETKGSSIVKCHRSFLVNRAAIISTSGNAQGLLLSLSDCDKTIPVSRSFVATFRNK